MTPPLLKDVTALVPVYQCADRLPNHVRFLQRLSPSLASLVWVVTPSEDGSHEIASKACQELGGKLISVPPGLYTAWNAGIREIRTKVTYISTVGEEITQEGLVAMIGLLRRHAADVCFSPPVVFPAGPDSFRRTRHWPVFRFAKMLEPYDGQLLPIPMLAALQAVSGISGMLGSCASCVFSTAVLQARPFPDDFLHYGDTAWFYANLCQLRTVYRKGACSTFHVHDFSQRTILRTDLDRCVEVLISEYRRIQPSSPLPALMKSFQHARHMTDHLREPHPFRFWWLNPWAWAWRLRRDILKARILAYVNPRYPMP